MINSYNIKNSQSSKTIIGSKKIKWIMAILILISFILYIIFFSEIEIINTNNDENIKIKDKAINQLREGIIEILEDFKVMELDFTTLEKGKCESIGQLLKYDAKKYKFLNNIKQILVKIKDGKKNTILNNIKQILARLKDTKNINIIKIKIINKKNKQGISIFINKKIVASFYLNGYFEINFEKGFIRNDRIQIKDNKFAEVQKDKTLYIQQDEKTNFFYNQNSKIKTLVSLEEIKKQMTEFFKEFKELVKNDMDDTIRIINKSVRNDIYHTIRMIKN